MGTANQYLCESGTTIIGRKGTINSPIFVNQRFWNIDTAFGLHPKEKLVAKFLFYYCKNFDFTTIQSGAAIPSLTRKDILKQTFTLPPLPVQTAIASELDSLQTVIDGYKAQLADLDALAQSVFLEMFGDPVGNPKGWECYRLDSICKTTAGGTPSKSKTENYSNGTINWLRSGEVNKHYIISTELKISNIGLNNSSAKVLPPNTVVVAMYGATAGQVGILKIESSTNQAVCGILPSSSISHEYLYFTILLLNTEIVKQAEGVAQPNISQGIIKALNIPLPPLPLQTQFASRVESIERQKEQIRQQLKDAETLMAERMQYYFG